jgi:hypothetical protein
MTNLKIDKLSETRGSASSHSNILSSDSQIEYHRPDLEAYIEVLRILDEHRKHSAKRRDYGIDVLKR